MAWSVFVGIVEKRSPSLSPPFSYIGLGNLFRQVTCPSDTPCRRCCHTLIFKPTEIASIEHGFFIQWHRNRPAVAVGRRMSHRRGWQASWMVVYRTRLANGLLYGVCVYRKSEKPLSCSRSAFQFFNSLWGAVLHIICLDSWLKYPASARRALAGGAITPR